MSPPSSLNVNSYGDEIVVNAHTNGNHDAQANNNQEQQRRGPDGDEAMNDAPDSRPSSSRLIKRTRSTAQNDPTPEQVGRLAHVARESYESLASSRSPRRLLPDSQERGVL